MNNTLIELDQALIDNSATRVPVCLCLDTSGSMGLVVADRDQMRETGETVFEDGQEWSIVTGGTTRAALLKKGLETLKKAVKEDVVARRSIELCIVSFNDRAECITDFCDIDHFKVPEIDPEGETEMGEGINLALDLLEDRKKMYRDYGVSYYQPILVIFSDGENTGSYNSLARARSRISELTESKKLSCFQIGIDEECDIEELTKINPKRPAKMLNSTKFNEFFIWLSKSTGVLSRSALGETPKLPSTDSWSTF